jgi:hypothetical protein
MLMQKSVELGAIFAEKDLDQDVKIKFEKFEKKLL